MEINQILKQFNYSELIKNNYIPDLSLQCEKLKTFKKCKYPSWVVSNKRFSEFHTYMKYMIYKMIQNIVPNISLDTEFFDSKVLLKKDLTEEFKIYFQQWSLNYKHPNIQWNEVAYATHYIIASLYNDKPNLYISKDEFNSVNLLLESINQSIISMFESCKNSNITVNIKFNIDIIINNMLLNIITTNNYNKKIESSFLQILHQTALIRKLNGYIDYVGILLPMQKDLLFFSVKEWNSQPFYDLLNNNINNINNINNNNNILSYVGTHIRKEKTISKSLLSHVEGYLKISNNVSPCQMFLRNPKTGQCNICESDINEALSIISENHISYFTHSIFIINLSNVNTQMSLNFITDDLRITSQIGGRGVVVHVGKSLKMNIDDALNVMEASIRKILPFATSECPLLLETPSGQGTELCRTIESFSSFYSRFNNDLRFGICIDTCHVFATGYDPFEYIQRWNILHPNSIKLIHFNDSMKTCGACVDRHAPAGKGYIGLEKLTMVASWANQYNIPMVIEYNIPMVIE